MTGVVYRSRLAGGLDGNALGYISSMSDDAEIIEYDILGSKAHVLMLHECGLLADDDVKDILSALNKVRLGSNSEGAAEDIHEFVESEVIRIAGIKSGGRIHTARSRNDQVVLDMRLKIRDDINVLCGGVIDTVKKLLTLAEQHQKSIMPLYTHLQQAQAGTLSHYLLAQVDILLRDVERFGATYGRINKNPLGAGPVGGTSIRIDRRRTSQLLGFDGLVENSIDATSSRDFAAEYVAALAILMTNLSRIAEDLVIWSTSEFAFVEMADEFSSPSSVMPQKKNPDILEITRSKAADVIGSLVTVLSATKGLATGYGRDLQQIKSRVWSSTVATAQAVGVIGSAVDKMTVNVEKMRKAAGEGHLVALDIAEKMVQYGTPFRQAHKIAGLLVQKAIEGGKGIPDLSRSEIKAVTGTSDDVERIYQITKETTISSSLEDRISEGSSGFAEQSRMIQERRRLIDEQKATVQRRRNRIDESLAELGSAVDRLIEGKKTAQPQ